MNKPPKNFRRLTMGLVIVGVYVLLKNFCPDLLHPENLQGKDGKPSFLHMHDYYLGKSVRGGKIQIKWVKIPFKQFNNYSKKHKTKIRKYTWARNVDYKNYSESKSLLIPNGWIETIIASGPYGWLTIFLGIVYLFYTIKLSLKSYLYTDHMKLAILSLIVPFIGILSCIYSLYCFFSFYSKFYYSFFPNYSSHFWFLCRDHIGYYISFLPLLYGMFFGGIIIIINIFAIGIKYNRTTPN